MPARPESSRTFPQPAVPLEYHSFEPLPEMALMSIATTSDLVPCSAAIGCSTRLGLRKSKARSPVSFPTRGAGRAGAPRLADRVSGQSTLPGQRPRAHAGLLDILLDKLGEGGMGAVFKARHAKLGCIVALKLIRKERLEVRWRSNAFMASAWPWPA